MSKPSPFPKVLIAVLSYNEEESLPHVLDSLVTIVGQLPYYSFDIVLFDDCSTDDSRSIASSYNFKVVSHVITSGNGMYMIPLYLRYAYDNNFDFVVQFDGDGQHDSTCIHRLLSSISNSDSDIIIGSRFFEASRHFFEEKSTYFDRVLGSRIVSFITLVITDVHITDPTSGFRVYNKKAISAISNSSVLPFDSLSFLCFCVSLNLAISEIQVSMNPRISGFSEFNLRRKFKYFFLLIYSFVYSSLLK